MSPIPHASIKLVPESGRDHLAQPRRLAHHLRAERPEGADDRPRDDQHGGEQGGPIGQVEPAADRRRDQVEDHRDQDRAEHQQEQVAQIPQQQRDADDDERDDKALDEDPMTDRLAAHARLPSDPITCRRNIPFHPALFRPIGS
jgi:hypothetical protein